MQEAKYVFYLLHFYISVYLQYCFISSSVALNPNDLHFFKSTQAFIVSPIPAFETALL